MRHRRIIVAAAAVILALNSPWLLESASSNCAALEQLGSRQILDDRSVQDGAKGVAVGLLALSDGRVAAIMASKHAPGVPPTLTCLSSYWSKRAGGP